MPVDCTGNRAGWHIGMKVAVAVVVALSAEVGVAMTAVPDLLSHADWSCKR